MKLKKIGKALNGTHLAELIGDSNTRIDYKKYLISVILDEKQEEERKKECKKELEHIRKLEEDTADKQEKHAAFRFGVFVIWSVILLVFVFVAYLVVTHMNGQLNLEKDTTKIFVSLISTLIVFQCGVGSASIFRGANIKVKEIKKN